MLPPPCFMCRYLRQQAKNWPESRDAKTFKGAVHATGYACAHCRVVGSKVALCKDVCFGLWHTLPAEAGMENVYTWVMNGRLGGGHKLLSCAGACRERWEWRARVVGRLENHSPLLQQHLAHLRQIATPHHTGSTEIMLTTYGIRLGNFTDCSKPDANRHCRVISHDAAQSHQVSARSGLHLSK